MKIRFLINKNQLLVIEKPTKDSCFFNSILLFTVIKNNDQIILTIEEHFKQKLLIKPNINAVIQVNNFLTSITGTTHTRMHEIFNRFLTSKLSKKQYDFSFDGREIISSDLSGNTSLDELSNGADNNNNQKNCTII